MDKAHWPQEIAMKAMEEIVVQNNTNSSCSKPSSNSSSLERRATRPQKEAAINCPRCNSTNTKFCYYNNYSLTQPRYFCKTCRRYWTEGGSLRNVPVGGGSRKNKRSSSSSSSSISSHQYSNSMSKKLPDLVVPPPAAPLLVSQNPSSSRMNMHAGQDLNLGFSSTINDFKTISELIQIPNFDGTKNINTTNSATTTSSAAQLSALELLTGITTRGMMNSFMPIPIPDTNSVYSASSGGQLMIPMPPEFKIPSLSFSLDGNNMGGNGTYGSSIHESSNGRLLFPFEDPQKTTTTTTTTTTHDHDHDDGQQNRDQNNGDTNGFWSGMLGGSW